MGFLDEVSRDCGRDGEMVRDLGSPTMTFREASFIGTPDTLSRGIEISFEGNSVVVRHAMLIAVGQFTDAGIDAPGVGELVEVDEVEYKVGKVDSWHGTLLRFSLIDPGN